MATKSKGVYVRAESEAEEIVARWGAAIAGPKYHYLFYRRCMRRGTWLELAYARTAIELCRRGYLFPPSAVTTAVDVTARELAPAANVKAQRVAITKAGCHKLALVLISQQLVQEEPERDRLAEEWSEQARCLDVDPTTYDPRDDLDSDPRERRARQWRYAGMDKRAMRDKLERGECVDLSGCERTAFGDYIVPADVWQDGVDYCDAESEEWIWSIGQCGAAILASTSTKYYQHPPWKCLFLR